MSNENKIRLVIVAAKSDEALRDKIEQHLKHTKISVWHTGKIQAGDMRKSVIEAELQKANIVVPLISADFWADRSRRNEIQGFIMAKIFELQHTKPLKIVPVLAKPYSWEQTEFKELDPLPSTGKPISTSRQPLDDLVEIAMTLDQIAKQMATSPQNIVTPKLSVAEMETSETSPPQIDKQTVFIVHGHNDMMKGQVQLLIERLGLKSVVLHEQTNGGRTIIEKFESFAKKAAFAIVILSADDYGYAKGKNKKTKKLRARQNVVFELGFFTGLLGRKKVAVLQETHEDFETVGDYSGVVYVPYDSGNWKLKLGREMQVAGLPVDLNRLF
ncbi:MAG: TIR domain-containing protein [Chitinophagales bacterium]